MGQQHAGWLPLEDALPCPALVPVLAPLAPLALLSPCRTCANLVQQHERAAAALRPQGTDAPQVAAEGRQAGVQALLVAWKRGMVARPKQGSASPRVPCAMHRPANW